MKTFWFSFYDMIGHQFGCTLNAVNEEAALNKFFSIYSDSQYDIADYGCCEEEI